MTCPTCKRQMSVVQMVGHKCYLCVLEDYPTHGYFKRKVYAKAVAVSLALATPLTINQARKVVRKYGIKDMQRLADLQNGRLVEFKPNNTFFARVMGARLK